MTLILLVSHFSFLIICKSTCTLPHTPKRVRCRTSTTFRVKISPVFDGLKTYRLMQRDTRSLELSSSGSQRSRFFFTSGLQLSFDLFAWCVRLSRLWVGFWTHFKSLHFSFSFHFISLVQIYTDVASTACEMTIAQSATAAVISEMK